MKRALVAIGILAELAPRPCWAQSAGERSAGVASVSAPVYDGSVVIAALSLSGPIERLTTEPGVRHAKRVVAAAKEIQRAAAAHY